MDYSEYTCDSCDAVAGEYGDTLPVGWMTYRMNVRPGEPRSGTSHFACLKCVDARFKRMAEER